MIPARASCSFCAGVKLKKPRGVPPIAADNMKRSLLTIFLALAGIAPATAQDQAGRPFRPEIPRTWDAEKLADFELPLAPPAPQLKFPPADYYYSIPARKPYQTYPIYAPGKEPQGYLEGLFEKAPQAAFDASRLRSKQDWIAAGRVIFESGGTTVVKASSPEPLRGTIQAMVGHYKVPVAADGTVPHFRYAVEKTGEVQIVGFMCVTCHSRVMPDGSVIYAAQSNMPVAAAVPPKGFDESLFKLLWSVPWLSPDPVEAVLVLPGRKQAEIAASMPPGVLPRIARSFTHPVQIPSLIGVKDRRYLDWTGLRQHRDTGDLMRYASFTADMDALIQYGDFIPAADTRGIHGRLPDAAKRQRWSDEQLYALALYLESLEPPENPNKPDDLSRKGKSVFESEGCGTCHTPPIYTNNKLTPVKGFKVPAEHRKKFDILDVVVGTDPTVALKTRGGTGYYRVPSLQGLWYRGLYEHNGSVASLEDWFDPARLRDDYVPSGYKGFGKTARAVEGHEFGLRLSADDKGALIAFLRTL